jgi:EVE domain
MAKAWIAVASADHVRKGRAGGFMQVSHGKSAPLKRIKPGDHVIYYSPTTSYGGRDRLQAFTAIGCVANREPYQGDTGGGFVPWRRDVRWFAAREAAIAPLLDQLEFSRGKKNWGFQFRLGLFAIGGHDLETIAEAMGAAHMVNKRLPKL